MSALYTTVQGDVLDAILWRVYGREDRLVAVLEANPGLCEHPPVLPPGLTIVLPPAPPLQPEGAPVRLWD